MLDLLMRFILLAFLPLTAYARGSGYATDWIYLGLGLVGALLFYRFWMVLLAIPVLLVYYLAKLFRLELSDGILKFSGGGSLFTFGIPIAFLPREYLELKWYYILIICLSVSTIFWFFVALLLQLYENKLNSKTD